MNRKRTVTPARVVYNKALKTLGYKHRDVLKAIDKNEIGYLSYPSLLMLLRRGTVNPYYPKLIESILNIPADEFVKACMETRNLYSISIDVEEDEQNVCAD